ncbi:T9SS ring complex lipoprotein PorK/GldK [Mucilaginibacter gracilis]|nr:SUMF1/EgtB/PvdO family nonheme iron enzyme [Mucilaginibacter gracilis]
MKLYYFIVFLVAGVVMVGCNTNHRGEVVGVYQRTFRAEVPNGMAYIPAGSFLMGPVDQDITFSQIGDNKQVSIPAFYMDEMELSNSKYKQFVNWVRDSIAITSYLNDDKYYIHPKGTTKSAANSRKYIDWDYVAKNPPFKNKKGQNTTSKLENMYYQGDDRVFDRNEIDVSRLKYSYAIYMLRDAANHQNDKKMKRSDFILRDSLAIYPDTLVWLRNFTYSANEPYAQGYFSHPAYQNYPVVGVTWRQARAFTVWRTKLQDAAAQDGRHLTQSRLPYDLPSDAQFEYAARGGRIGTNYPWGGPYIKNAKGCLLANFKPGRGNYTDDGGLMTVKVNAYLPNDYGLYNMAGNVAEWTSSAYDEASSSVVSDLNPSFTYNAKATDPEVKKRKVVRGGSFKDVGYFLQNSTRTYEYQDTAKAYIGFRCVTSFIGRDIKDRN